MVNVETITEEEYEAAEMAKTKKGKWTDVIKQVIEDGECVKVSGLSRGQVAALWRKAKDSKVKVVANYKAGSVSLAPA